jgi:hypothetical protein
MFSNKTIPPGVLPVRTYDYDNRNERNSEKNGKLLEQILNKGAFFDYCSALTEKRINQLIWQ